jgi:formaldehyde-activating enzyme involved in methanogenesis
VDRVKRAEKVTSSAERFDKKVNELHLEVQEEIKGVVDYFQELLNVLAVDCHAAYLGAGKFLKFEALQKEKIYQTEKEAMKQASDAAEEAESEEQSAYQGTVDRANRARRSVFFCFCSVL